MRSRTIVSMLAKEKIIRNFDFRVRAKIKKLERTLEIFP